MDRRRAERQAVNAGSQDTDAEGRRVDDREFAETKDVLRLLETSAIGWCRQRNGRFRRDLVGGVYSPEDFEKRHLPRQHGIVEHVTPDQQEASYWRQTASGWFLGISARRVGDRFDEWLYAGPTSPIGGPEEYPAAWGERFDTPPDWM